MAGPPEENPLHLIEQIVRGDREAFGRFYDRFAPLVFTFAARFLRVRSDAEDLLQEVFFQAWRQAGSYRRERGNPEAWLLTIARSRAIDKLRSIRRRDRSFISMTSEEKYEGKTENAAVGPDVGLMINSALGRLPEAQRKVLEMAYFDGLTQSEIAGRLKEPLGTVKTRMRAALGRLRESLAGKAGGDPS
jgi:RNA polymerase sigma-70 factor (ECF subfamily)